MLVVYLFLGNLRGTLIIGSAIPIAIMVTFILMAMGGLSLNIMTLGGLALGVGMLVDNTIVMLENIQRHQRSGEGSRPPADRAAAEVNSADHRRHQHQPRGRAAVPVHQRAGGAAVPRADLHHQRRHRRLPGGGA
jgi:Cu/Ag efflux pump CusA